MKFILALLPTILLTSYSQLITKWRVSHLQAITPEVKQSAVERAIHYLTDPYIISAYAFSLLSSIAWLYAVEKYPVSIAFPTYIGVLFVVVVFGSNLLLREPLSLQHLAGIALILTGVVVASRAA